MANKNPKTDHLKQHQFKKGKSGNPGGKTAEHRQAETRAAELSAQIRLKMLEKFAAQIEDGEMKVEDLLDAAALRLFKDSEDRAHGTPKQEVDMKANIRHRGSITWKVKD